MNVRKTRCKRGPWTQVPQVMSNGGIRIKKTQAPLPKYASCRTVAVCHCKCHTATASVGLESQIACTA